MKANEFVKKYGWVVASTDLRNHEKYNTRSILYNYDDLKRLVEAHELVESYGGLEVAKTCEYSEDLDHVKYNVDLAKAINLVESCQ